MMVEPPATKAPLSIEAIARQTGLEESLLRFYESEYPEQLPAKVLYGNILAFGPGAAEAFQRIHDMHHGGMIKPERVPETERYARVIAITSGKGGVGKTNLALNLAIELQRLGRMCVLLDADMGMANVHLLAGINPRHDLRELILDPARKITDLIMEGPEGIGIIPGGGGILALADSSNRDRMRILRALREVEQEADIILVDTGAGMSSSVRDFLVAADEILFVLTPDITSLADGYGLLKSLHHDERFGAPAIYSLVNMAQNLTQAADTARRFAGCSTQFLNRQVESLGYVLRDATVSAATARRKPYTVFQPEARVSKNTRTVATLLVKKEMPEIRINSAFGRYLNILQHQAG